MNLKMANIVLKYRVQNPIKKTPYVGQSKMKKLGLVCLIKDKDGKLFNLQF